MNRHQGENLSAPAARTFETDRLLKGQQIKSVLVFLFTVLASPSARAGPAAAVHDCGGLDSIGNLVGNVRLFAQGAISVAHISTEEPAAAPEHLLIFVAKEPMGVGCYAVSATADGQGFSSIGMNALRASYDSNKGLLISVPIFFYDTDKGSVPAGRLKVRISRKSGNNSVTIEQ
jgi:hypothetical protein